MTLRSRKQLLIPLSFNRHKVLDPFFRDTRGRSSLHFPMIWNTYIRTWKNWWRQTRAVFFNLGYLEPRGSANSLRGSPRILKSSLFWFRFRQPLNNVLKVPQLKKRLNNTRLESRDKAFIFIINWKHTVANGKAVKSRKLTLLPKHLKILFLKLFLINLKGKTFSVLFGKVVL